MAAAATLISVNLSVAQNSPSTMPSAGVTARDMETPLPAGITAKDLNKDKAIEKAFKKVTEDAMSKTGFDNIVSNLVDQDRVRIKNSLASGRSLSDVRGDKNKQFTDVVASIEGAWKSKYNQKFDIDTAKVFAGTYIHIQTGEVTDAQMLLGKWPVQAATMAPDMGGSGKVTQSDVDQAKGKMFGGDVNLEKGRNVALVHLSSNNDWNSLNASMIHEAGGWVFDIPNNITGDQLYDNVVKNLTVLDQRRDAWPADVNDAYRTFTLAVTSALYDITSPRRPGVAMAH